MKSTGIIRRIDNLGRLVVPKELRKVMGLKEKDPMEFFVDGNQIILEKYAPGCLFCGEETELFDLWGKQVCRECQEKIKKAG